MTKSLGWHFERPFCVCHLDWRSSDFSFFSPRFFFRFFLIQILCLTCHWEFQWELRRQNNDGATNAETRSHFFRCESSSMILTWKMSSTSLSIFVVFSWFLRVSWPPFRVFPFDRIGIVLTLTLQSGSWKGVLLCVFSFDLFFRFVLSKSFRCRLEAKDYIRCQMDLNWCDVGIRMVVPGSSQQNDSLEHCWVSLEATHTTVMMRTDWCVCLSLFEAHIWFEDWWLKHLEGWRSSRKLHLSKVSHFLFSSCCRSRAPAPRQSPIVITTSWK